ncbi:glycosyltransferase family 2 protein [Arenibaculum sp.]|uniref:glycosyltransferase family 2 protein n=1 Tax=Arenibaculum sp. TaxID=2865862 RepID=UPI002E0E07A6|nr:glycosyltransferase family 2 protein [Arenibaculum sp.]
MPRIPLVSILMPARDAAPWITGAIDSLLTQTLADWELVLVDDGSTDGTADIASRFADERLTLLRNAVARGPARALDQALAVARGRFLARLDADDIALPERLARQVAFLERQPETGVCGSDMTVFSDGDASAVHWRYPTCPDDLHCALLATNPLSHPTVMIVRDRVPAQELRYDQAFTCTEDFDLWARLAGATRFANIPEPLVRHRRHATNVSRTRFATLLAESDAIRARLVRALVPDASADDLALHNRLLPLMRRGADPAAGRDGTEIGALLDWIARCEVELRGPLPEDAPRLAARWFTRLRDANRRAGIYPPAALDRLLEAELGRFSPSGA